MSKCRKKHRTIRNPIHSVYNTYDVDDLRKSQSEGDIERLAGVQ